MLWSSCCKGFSFWYGKVEMCAQQIASVFFWKRVFSWQWVWCGIFTLDEFVKTFSPAGRISHNSVVIVEKQLFMSLHFSRWNWPFVFWWQKSTVHDDGKQGGPIQQLISFTSLHGMYFWKYLCLKLNWCCESFSGKKYACDVWLKTPHKNIRLIKNLCTKKQKYQEHCIDVRKLPKEII